MFNLTQRSLDNIFSRCVQSNTKIPLKPEVEGETKFRLLDFDQRIIVQISDIQYFKQENILAIELYDGSEINCNSPAFLDESVWNRVESFYLSESDFEDSFYKHERLKVGSIIMLKEYTFEDILTFEEFDEREADIDYYIYDCLKIVDFFVLGFDSHFKSDVNQ